MNREITHTVLLILGAALILAIGGIITLTALHIDTPGVLNDSVGYILIGMLGLLSTGPRQQVEVTNTAAEPIPTEAVRDTGGLPDDPIDDNDERLP